VGARRVVLRDRRGRPSATLDWRDDATLAAATVRLPDHSWLSIEPSAGVEAPWGAIDRVSRGGTPLTAATAIDWARVSAIPTVAEPARIPAGGGTAILNLLAILARDQGVPRLVYAGPYPTEALFMALLESFRPDPADDALARFTRGELAWIPAPFTPSFDGDVYVQWRDRVEKVMWRGRAYYREDWSGVRRHAHLRVHDAGDTVRCALWALGAPLEDHLVLDADGTLRAIVARGDAPAGGDAAPGTVRAAVREGLVAMVIALSAPPLGDSVRGVTAALRFTCGRVDGDLARADDDEVRISTTLAGEIARRLRDAAGGLPAPAAAHAARAQLALAALAEIARVIADPLRARAQRRLAAATPEAQAEALRRETVDPRNARTITAAVADLVASGRVDDEPDVEGDEAGDRDD
jgi:hypothetical protein